MPVDAYLRQAIGDLRLMALAPLPLPLTLALDSGAAPSDMVDWPATDPAVDPNVGSGFIPTASMKTE